MTIITKTATDTTRHTINSADELLPLLPPKLQVNAEVIYQHCLKVLETRTGCTINDHDPCIVARKDEDTTTETEGFHITDEASAAWLLRKLRAIQEEQAAIKAATAARIAELAADEARLNNRFGAELEAWARGEAEKRRRKTITVPLAGMQVAFRTVSGGLKIADQQDAMTTARAVCPEAITTETVEIFDKERFLEHAKTALDSAGELLPGVEIVPDRESFSVKVAKVGKGGETE